MLVLVVWPLTSTGFPVRAAASRASVTVSLGRIGSDALSRP
jgi:hypothetical protein